MNTLKLNIDQAQGLEVKINGEVVCPDKQDAYIYRSDKHATVDIEISSVQQGIKVSFWELFLDALFGLFGSVTPNDLPSKIINFRAKVLLDRDKIFDLIIDKSNAYAPISCADPELQVIDNYQAEDPAVVRYNRARKISLIIFASLCLVAVAIVLLFVFVF